MAFIKDVELNNGLTIKNAYVKIDTVGGCKERIDISVNSYISQEDFSNKKGSLDKKNYYFVPSVADDAPNYHKQGYEYLKTLSEFATAVDV